MKKIGKFFLWVWNFIIAIFVAIFVYSFLKKKPQNNIDIEADRKLDEIKKQNKNAVEGIKNETNTLSITDIVNRLKSRVGWDK